jgi:thiamine pyrophosphate-dependent acetolactate synthase large subunit-like protein
MAASEHSSVLSSALADLLANDYSPVIVQLPKDLPLPPAHDAPVTLRFLGSEHLTTQAQVQRTWQGLKTDEVFKHLQNPAVDLL